MGIPARAITVSKTTANTPFVVVDNFFGVDEEKEILRELEFIRPHFSGPGSTGGDRHADGSTKKHNNSMGLWEFFARPSVSNIWRLSNQFTDPGFVADLAGDFWPARYMKEIPTFADNVIQLLYYEQNDNYETHVDQAFLTYLYWTYKTPRKFTGGDVILDGKTTIKCQANRLLIFPSVTPHKVTSVSMEENAPGYGRYCVSNFLHWRSRN